MTIRRKHFFILTLPNLKIKVCSIFFSSLRKIKGNSLSDNILISILPQRYGNLDRIILELENFSLPNSWLVNIGVKNDKNMIYLFNIYKVLPYNKVIGSLSVCLSVCVYRRISLTAEPVWFSFTV